jgi:hypothetical protein
VKPPSGAEVLLADRFTFRSDAPATDDLGHVALKSGHFDNELRVTNHTVKPEGGVVEWVSTLSWPGSLHDLGTGNTGVRVVEFDVTPLARPIDGVVGYADTSTTVTEEPGVTAPPDGERLADDGHTGCAAAPGSTMAMAGLLLWLLRSSRRPRGLRRQR